MHWYYLEYGIPWSGFLSAELNSQVNSFLKRAFKYGFCSRLYTIEAIIAEDADIDLFYKMTKVHHYTHPLLSRVKSCTHYLRPKGHICELPRFDSKSHL